MSTDFTPRRERTPRPSRTSVAALALALVALVVAAGPRALAAMHVTSKDIVNKTIKSIDIKDGNVKTPDLASGAVTAPKLTPTMRNYPLDAAYVTASNPTIAAPGVLFTRSVTVPATGTLLVRVVSSYWTSTAAAGAVQNIFKLNAGPSSTDTSLTDSAMRIQQLADGTNSTYTPLVVAGYFPVTKGTFTFNLTGYRSSTTAGTTFQSLSTALVTAEWFPA